jgi:small subunit ribosomal protein S6
MSTATSAIKQRDYELIYLLKQDASEEQIDKIQSRLADTLRDQFNGSVLREETWGKRRLAYTIKKGSEKHNRALYKQMIFRANPGATQELERLLRITDFCIRFMHIRLDQFDPSAQPKIAQSAEETPAATTTEEAN